MKRLPQVEQTRARERAEQQPERLCPHSPSATTFDSTMPQLVTTFDRAVRKAIWFGVLSAAMTWLLLESPSDLRRTRGVKPSELSHIIVCGPEDSGMRAGTWSFITFVAVFTPTLFVCVGRTRRNPFKP